MVDKDKINDFLISKFLEFSNLDVTGFTEGDLYELGRYDAFEEVSEFLCELAKNNTH